MSKVTGVRAKLRDGTVELFSGATGWVERGNHITIHEPLGYDGAQQTIALIPMDALMLVEYETE